MSATEVPTEPTDPSRPTESTEPSVVESPSLTVPQASLPTRRASRLRRVVVAGLVSYLSTASLSLILAIVLVFVAVSALATALGTSIGSPSAPTASGPQLSLSDLGTLLRSLISFTGYTFFASQLTPIEASASGGATYAVLGIGSATITLVAILVPFAFARRLERAIPSVGTMAAAGRGFAIAAPYWIGATALYLASFIAVGNSQLGLSVHPSGLALVLPALLVGIGAALGAASVRPPEHLLAQSVFRGLARASIAIIVGVLMTVVLVLVVYALQSASSAPSTSTAGSLPTSPAARDLGWGLLALVPFYLLNGAGLIWTAALGGVLFKGTAWAAVVLLGPAVGVLAGCTQLRRVPDRIEQASFALGFAVGTLLISIATTPAIINGPAALPAPTTAVLMAIGFGAVAAFIGPYLLSLRPVRSLAASRPLKWVIRPTLALWPADNAVAPGVVEATQQLRLPRVGRIQALAAGILIVLVAGGLLANSQLSSRFSPEQTAIDYLDAQRRGNADAMWALATYQSASGTGGELLSKAALSKMLSDPVNTALSDIHVTDSARADDSNFTITVQLKRDGQDGAVPLHVRKDASRSNWLIYPAWRVVIPASTVMITTFKYAGAVTIDGFASGVTDVSGSVEVIPGRHQVALQSTDIFIGDTQVVDATTNANVTFKATLTSTATTAVNTAISNLFTRCAAVHQLSPAGCPNSAYPLGDHQSNVSWSLVGDPTSGIQLAIGDQVDTITANGQWKMHLSYTYWYDFDPGFVEHWDEDVSGYFNDTLHWNGSGFDITNQSGF